MVQDKSPDPASSFPQYEQDKLYTSMAKGSKRATQVVPEYEDFRLGHGDPLVEAQMTHDHELAKSPRSQKKMLQNIQDSGDINLKQNLSPISGYGCNDVVHAGKDTISVPCLPFGDLNESKERKEEREDGKPINPAAGMKDVVHMPSGAAVTVPIVPAALEEKKTIGANPAPGMKDVVHLPSGSAISVPVVPAALNQEEKTDDLGVLDVPVVPRTENGHTPSTAEQKKDQLENDGSHLAGMGMSDMVHLQDGSVVSIPCVQDESQPKK